MKGSSLFPKRPNVRSAQVKSEICGHLLVPISFERWLVQFTNDL